MPLTDFVEVRPTLDRDNEIDNSRNARPTRDSDDSGINDSPLDARPSFDVDEVGDMEEDDSLPESDLSDGRRSNPSSALDPVDRRPPTGEGSTKTEVDGSIQMQTVDSGIALHAGGSTSCKRAALCIIVFVLGVAAGLL